MTYKENLKKSFEIKASLEDDDDEYDNKFGNPKKTSNEKSNTPVLDTYSRDLTKMAAEGRLDTIVGREKEIERVSQILSRRKKNNPILLGEAGCVDGDTIITVKKISGEIGHEIINI
jgi:ATP-dependent Clp protease ATP-binding subunit ClpC